ncbi:MAG: hypothetical protein ABIQ49_15180 [Gemmatimonadales bacterium]
MNGKLDRIARALDLNYVYYPGAIHPTEHQYFGPADLSPWPIVRSWRCGCRTRAGPGTRAAPPTQPRSAA